MAIDQESDPAGEDAQDRAASSLGPSIGRPAAAVLLSAGLQMRCRCSSSGLPRALLKADFRGRSSERNPTTSLAISPGLLPSR